MKHESDDISVGEFLAPNPAELSALLTGYEVSALIACGGMGAVYFARQKSLDRDVAIKILPRKLGANPQFRASFEFEAKAMARLNHPNLVGVHDFGEVDDYLFIIMEMVHGKSLFHSAHGKVIDQKRVAHLIHDICEGLAHAHKAGIIHRDIKPANILLDSTMQPRIGDFGLARPADSRTSGGMHFGTPDYVAPEVMEGPEHASKSSDVFAVGIILYELLTGEFPGKNYVPPSQIQKVDARFDKIVRRAMHPAPAMRFANAGEMAKEVGALKDALDKPGSGLMTSAPSSSSDLRQSNNTAPPASLPAPTTSGYQQAIARNLVIIAVLLVSIVIAWGAYGRKKKKKAQARDLELAEHEKVIPTATPKKVASRPPDSGPSGRPKPRPQPKLPAPESELPPTLARLKRDLALGNRSRFPKGTLERGEVRVFFVDEPMSWRKASEFAEDHGGHLATLPSEAEKSSLFSHTPKGVTVWLGAGSAGPSRWGWVDGSPWTLSDSPSESSGAYLVLSSSGTILSKPGGTEYPFFIQWHLSAINPGSLEAQFNRLKDSSG